MLAQYPQGLQSVDPTIVDKLPNGNVASAISGAEYSISVDPGRRGARAVLELTLVEVADHVFTTIWPKHPRHSGLLPSRMLTGMASNFMFYCLA